MLTVLYPLKAACQATRRPGGAGSAGALALAALFHRRRVARGAMDG